ncbi:hypothetical protein MMC17_007719 [Xylographa soralifera]|nr:hypothetical protein [Xylographa soralifera]
MPALTPLSPVHLQPQPQPSMSMQMTPSSSSAAPPSNEVEQPRLGLRGGGMVSDWCVVHVGSNLKE